MDEEKLNNLDDVEVFKLFLQLVQDRVFDVIHDKNGYLAVLSDGKVFMIQVVEPKEIKYDGLVQKKKEE